MGRRKAKTAEGQPLYQKVKSHITDRIARGRLVGGDPVPSENELTRELGVSRMTANRALRELMAEGILRRVQGVGSFVAPPKPQSELLEIRNIADDVRGRGHRYNAIVVKLGRGRADAALARALGLPPGGAVFHSLIVHCEDEIPVQLEDRHVNPQFAPDYLKQDFTRITPYAYLTSLGSAESAEHVIEAVLPDVTSQRLLKIRGNEPCLLLTRRTWTAGRAVTRARLMHPGSRYRLVGRREYGAAPARRQAT
ncbi:MAG: histidine utilization repressor [Dongiaceae bacterium]